MDGDRTWTVERGRTWTVERGRTWSAGMAVDILADGPGGAAAILARGSGTVASLAEGSRVGTDVCAAYTQNSRGQDDQRCIFKS